MSKGLIWILVFVGFLLIILGIFSKIFMKAMPEYPAS